MSRSVCSMDDRPQAPTDREIIPAEAVYAFGELNRIASNARLVTRKLANLKRTDPQGLELLRDNSLQYHQLHLELIEALAILEGRPSLHDRD